MKIKHKKLIAKMSNSDFENLVKSVINSLHQKNMSTMDRPIEKSFVAIFEQEIEKLISLSRPSKTKDRNIGTEIKRDKIAINTVREKRHKPAKKRQKLHFYQDEIERLRKNEEMSWREIANYLAIRHKFKVHYSTIVKFMKAQRSTK